MKRPRGVPSDSHSRREIRRFVLRFVAGWGVVLLILSTFPWIEDLAILGTSTTLASALRPFVPVSTGSDGGLSVGRLHWRIVPDCTPLMPTVTLALAMLAYPASLAWRVSGLLVGASVLWIFNLIRLMIQFVIETWLPPAADFVHIYFFQVLAFVFVCALFVAWIRLQRKLEPS